MPCCDRPLFSGVCRESNSATGSSGIYPEGHFNLYRDFSASALKGKPLYPTSMLDNIDYAYHIVSRDGIDNVSDIDGEAKTEDIEVRMDLTDDLLHMVVEISYFFKPLISSLLVHLTVWFLAINFGARCSLS